MKAPPKEQGQMAISDDAVEIRTQGWRTLAALHGLIDAALERALQSKHDLSVVEFTVMDSLSRQDGWHMRMQQLRVRPPSAAAHQRGSSTDWKTAGC